MKIQSIKLTGNLNSNNYSTKPINNFYSTSFKGSNDTFVKVADDTLDVACQKIKLRFQKLLEEAHSKKTYSNILEEINEIQSQNNQIARISEEYKIILEVLNSSSKKNISKDAQIILDFLNAKDKIAKDKGWNRVSGYQKIKDDLEKEFILKDVMMSHTSQNKEVPNALLVFGPQSIGKSLFAKAIAEETLSNILVVDAGEMTKEEAMQKILGSAKKAKQDYINSKGQKQRTIILINEAEVLANPKSTVFKNFKKLIQDCSKEYNCTLFLTSNHPEFFDKSILSSDITKFKIGIEPADKKTCKQIVTDRLTKAETLPNGDIDRLINAFFKNPNEYYSNGDIVTVLDNALAEFKNPSIENYLKIIDRNDVPPSISKEALQNFYATQKNLEF